MFFDFLLIFFHRTKNIQNKSGKWTNEKKILNLYFLKLQTVKKNF